jgi:hypothetical protein
LCASKRANRSRGEVGWTGTKGRADGVGSVFDSAGVMESLMGSNVSENIEAMMVGSHTTQPLPANPSPQSLS